MRTFGVCVLVLASGLVTSAARASCKASAAGAFSFDSRLKPMPRECRMTVEVFAGPVCGASPAWQAVLPCDQEQHTAISDRGRLISILTPVATRRDLNAVRVTWGPIKYAWVTLGKLTADKPPKGKGSVRLSFQGDALVVAADTKQLIPFETVRHLASVLAD
jgi:hypothetical protein